MALDRQAWHERSCSAGTGSHPVRGLLCTGQIEAMKEVTLLFRSKLSRCAGTWVNGDCVLLMHLERIRSGENFGGGPPGKFLTLLRKPR